MASIIQVGDKWRALIRRKGHAAQCKTFTTKAQAERWAKQREADIAGGTAPQLAGLTMEAVIKAYRKLREASRPISDSSNEHYMLKALTRGIGHLQVSAMTPQHLVDYANLRREEGAGPYTINMDISKLGTAMRYGGAALRVALPDVVGAARPLLLHLRLIGGGGRRERRPTEDELRRIIDHLHSKRGLVYADAVSFAAVSAMRRGELCAFTVADIEQKTHIVQLWRKHPRQGKMLERVPLLGEAWDIVARQPVTAGPVFPIHPGTLSKYFTDACRALEVTSLHAVRLVHVERQMLAPPAAAIHHAIKFFAVEKLVITLRQSHALRVRHPPVKPLGHVRAVAAGPQNFRAGLPLVWRFW